MLLPNPQTYLANLPDPRRETKNKLHKLEDILMIVLCALLSGIDDWVGMEDFAQDREEWFRAFLELPNGIPSHDTLSAVMGKLDPDAFARAFTAWIGEALPRLAGRQVAIDGKALRGCGGRPVPLVSAFVTETRLVLGQGSVEVKSNEITAIPDLLDLLDLRGATVTMDALSCQKAIARQIVESGGDYVLALKDNHPTLCEEVTLWLDREAEAGRLPVWGSGFEKDHGRLERRRYWLSDQVAWLPERQEWAGLTAVGRVERYREVEGKASCERSYFLCSCADLERFSRVVRDHWGTENQQHWVLDVQFGEDHNRTRTDHASRKSRPGSQNGTQPDSTAWNPASQHPPPP
jgi:predicted transposase YbfD/YdcC